MVTGPAPVLAALVVTFGWLAVRDTTRWWSAMVVGRRLDTPAPRPVPAWIGRRFVDAGVDGDPRVHLRLWALAVAAAGAFSAVLDGGRILVAVALAGPPGALFASTGRGDRLRTAQIPAMLDAVAGSLRGGSALAVAISDATSVGGRLGAELETMTRHVRTGRPLRDAVAEWARSDDPGTSLAGAALTVAATLGGPGADAVEAAAASLRERAAIDGEVAALAVQARLSAGILSVAPLGFAVLLVSLDPTSAHFLLATPAGWACIAVGLALDAAGGLWMRRLVRSAA